MPKKRVSGRLGRPNRGRRRRDADASPLPPQSQEIEDVSGENDGSPPPARSPVPPPRSSQPVATGRLRPTQRMTVGQRGARPATAPSIDVDYRYLRDDLRQILLLAAAAFVLLGGLAFVIN